MRTSDEGHHRAVQDVWSKLQAEGLIYKGEYSGWYSITDECFYTDSQVVTVPLSPSSSTLSSLPTQDNLPQSETISLETGSTVELTSETNYMFRLSSFRSLLLEHYSSNPDIVHPPQYYQEVLAMLGQGDSATATELADISISRPRSRLSWGVEVPGDQEQTVYVWFDALLIYLTGAGYPWSPPLCNASQTSPPTESQWPWPADLQVIGKDILKFHAIYFPAILLALSSSSTQRLSPALPKRLLTHAHWTSNQKKMSKSLGNVADPMAFIRARGEEKKAGAYDVDAVRFYLMRVGGRWRDDVDWSEEQLDKHVKEAQSQLGNYFLRITSPKIAARAVKADSTDATHNAGPGHELNTELLAMSRSLPGKVAERMDALEAGEALDEIMQVLKFANRAVTIIAPWSATSPPQLVRETRLVALETLRMVGICMQPYMPGVGQTLLGALGLPIEDVAWEADETKESWEEVQRRWDERVVEGVRLFL
ncbi:tRNA synthetases class I (M)-domain-containing protein [Crassisporium funariophilum]|nr:tRNA synthetases class I (M)-domain-containing protein [Crassisporium funariophilum]